MHRNSWIGLATMALSSCLMAAILMVPDGMKAQTTKAAKDAAMVQAGQAIFSAKCMVCHSVNEGQVMLGPSLYHVMKKAQGKKTAAEIRVILKNGKGKMPSFQDKLTPEDTDNILAYLHSL
jgi:mono/diheme cytochrome c family protein